MNKQDSQFDTGPHTKPVNDDNNDKHQNDSKSRKQTKKKVSST